MSYNRTDTESVQSTRTDTYWSRIIGDGRLHRLAAIVVVLFVLTTGGTSVAIAQEGGSSAPSVPAAYYGDATIDGDPAPVGTEIVALVDGEEHGSIEVSEAGTYGGPNALDEKLVVEGAEHGDEVSFAVRGVSAAETVEWQSGDVREVDLTFEDVPDETDDGSADESNDGDGSDSDEGTPPGDSTDDGSDAPNVGGGSGGAGGAAPGGSTDEPTPDDDRDSSDTTDGTDDGTTTTDAEVLSETAATITVDSETERSRASFEEDAPVTAIEFETDAVSGTAETAELADPPEETGSPPGESLVVADIQVPDDAAEQSATVRMRVSPTRLEDANVAADALRVHRFANGEWQALETQIAEEGSDGIVLEADTPGFSYFSVSAVGEPNAELTISPATMEPGTDVTLDGSGSEDQSGEIVSYQWTVGDRELSGETATFAVDEPDEYTVELLVTNDAGATDRATETLVVSGGDDTDESTPSGVDGDENDGNDGEPDDPQRETFGALPPVWLIGAVVLTVAGGIAVAVLRRRKSSPNRL